MSRPIQVFETPNSREQRFNSIDDLYEKLNTHTHTWDKIVGKPNTFTPASHSHSEYAVVNHIHSDLNNEITGIKSKQYYGTCTTAGGTANKVVTCEGFVLEVGVEIEVLFSNFNTVSEITLNVNNTGAKGVFFNHGLGAMRHAIASNSICKFRYDGTNYMVVGFPSFGIADSSSAQSLSKNGRSLVTERDVFYALPTFNGKKMYTSDTNYVVPSKYGTQGYILQAMGDATEPVWVDPSNINSSIKNYYGTTSDNSGNSTKNVTCDGFELVDGVVIDVYFDYGSSSEELYLNINNTGAIRVSCYTMGYDLGFIPGSSIVRFKYVWGSYSILVFPPYGISDYDEALEFTSNNRRLLSVRSAYYGTPTINDRKDYTSDTKIYAPESKGSNGQILMSSESGPKWIDRDTFYVYCYTSADELLKEIHVPDLHYYNDNTTIYVNFVYGCNISGTDYPGIKVISADGDGWEDYGTSLPKKFNSGSIVKIGYNTYNDTWYIIEVIEAPITNSSAITSTGLYSLDAVEKNASVSGTMANDIATIKSNYNLATVGRSYQSEYVEINQCFYIPGYKVIFISGVISKGIGTGTSKVLLTFNTAVTSGVTLAPLGCYGGCDGEIQTSSDGKSLIANISSIGGNAKFFMAIPMKR